MKAHIYFELYGKEGKHKHIHPIKKDLIKHLSFFLERGRGKYMTVLWPLYNLDTYRLFYTDQIEVFSGSA